jgi:hypothetical protein
VFGVRGFLQTYLSASTQFVEFCQMRCMRGLNVSGTRGVVVVGKVGLIGELVLSGNNLRSSIIIAKLKPTCSHGKSIVIRAQAEEKE